MQSLDPTQPEHGPLHKRSGELKALAWRRYPTLCPTSSGRVPAPSQAAFNLGFHLGGLFAFLHTGQRCPLLFDLVSQAPR